MKIPALPSILLLALVSLAAPAAAADKGFSVEKTASGGAIVKYDGKLVTEYVVDQANKPYLFPVIPPHGTPMTRAYPMQKVEGEQWDHPHHRGICLGHEATNGFDTWAEKTTFEERKSDKKAQERLTKVGAQKHREFKELKAEGDKATIVAVTDYNNPQGKKEFEDTRTIVLQVIDGRLVIDYDVTFKATDVPVTFEDRKDAGFSIRVPTSMAEVPEKGKKSGTIVNSNGEKDEANAWGKSAKWCDYYGPVNGKVFGVAILNHPKSFRYPTPWHVRGYGLFTANPFGTKNLSKSAPDGTYTLKPGETTTLRYRLIFHEGDTASAKLDEAFATYEKLP